MHKLNTIIITISMFLISSCSSIELFKERTEITSHEAYTSFAIVNKEINLKGFSDELIDAQVINELEKQMKSLGLRYDVQSQDLLLRYSSNEDLRQRKGNDNQFPLMGMRLGDSWMYDPRYIGQQNFEKTKDYELIQLIVNFIDPKQDKMLMTITAVSEATSKKSKDKNLIKSAKKVVKAYQAHIENN